MKIYLDLIRASRRKLLFYIEGLGIEQVNVIPEGFNNNIAWHVGHLVASQQMLCYRFSGLKSLVNDETIDRFKNGTKPEGFMEEEEFNKLTGFLTSTIDKMEQDIGDGIFQEYKPFHTTFFDGLKFDSLGEVLAYVPAHESLHLGFCMALKRAIIQQQH